MKSARTEVAVRRDLTELESDLCDATHMALIAADLIDDTLGNRLAQAQVTGRPNTYFIGEEEADAVIYAANQVHVMIRSLRDRYLRALLAGGVTT
jgi:hypothetical protein